VPTNGAQAAAQCGPHDKITEVLSQRFQENRQSLGLAGRAALIEIFVSTQGTWTMTSTNAQGLTCVVAAGEAWQNAQKQLAGLNS
jgi:hypothetical protein